MRKRQLLSVCIILSISIVSVVAFADTYHRVINAYYDSQDNVVNAGWWWTGTPEPEATFFIVHYFHHITDSEGTVWSYKIGRQVFVRKNGKWKFVHEKWKTYEEIRAFHDRHTSN